jgi:hypothetical protein
MMAKRLLFCRIPECQITNSLVQHLYHTTEEGSPEVHRSVKKIDKRSGIMTMTSPTTVDSDIFQLRSNVLHGQTYNVSISPQTNWLFVTFLTAYQHFDKEPKETKVCFLRNITQRQPSRFGRGNTHALHSVQSECLSQIDVSTFSQVEDSLPQETR